MVAKNQPAELEMGPTAKWVAEGIREHRLKRQLSFADLEKRLTEVGHRIHALGLRRIEARTRRVDVDDLMAIAAVLNVSPLRLLLHIPDFGQGQSYEVATGVPEDLPWVEVAAWVRDETGLSTEERIQFWRREVRVQERMVADRTRDVEELAEQLATNPDDPTLTERHYWAYGLVSLNEKNHAEAIETLADLETQHKEDMKMKP